jgi:hypothetical protein
MTGGKIKSQADLTTLMRKRVEDLIPPKEFDRFSWTWTVRQQKGSKPPVFIVAGSGVRTSCEIYRVLTKQENGQTVPVTPNHLDPGQFGRST